jgi:tRNA A-37 threonylcarbamoyl transferase component Bud32
MTDSAQKQTLTRLLNGELKGIKRLDLSCQLSEFPEAIFDLADSLEILNLSGNKLKKLPHNLSQLKKLKVIFCSNNPFTHVPEVLGECHALSMIGFKACEISHLSANALPKYLQWLILTDNQLSTIPTSIGHATNLQKLMLAGNQLCALPESLQACEKLELLRISANQFNDLPAWLLNMPSLAWLALAGNPLNLAQETNIHTNHHLADIGWQDLTLGHQLGEGASGIIYQAILHADQTLSKAVAVKLFKGAVTSDGLPQSEMAACIAAGCHPHLTAVEGILKDHPQETQGIVMRLIDPAFKILANPPSLVSCTRDVYDQGKTLSIEHIVNIAKGIASAVAQLHQKGILHGDLYAHNILHTPYGDCLLSDFGGASFLPVAPQRSESIQKIEVRAFSILLAELIQLNHSENAEPVLTLLRQIHDDCASKTVHERPLMREVEQRLNSLQF